MFYNCKLCNNIGGLKYLDTSKCKIRNIDTSKC